MYQYRLCTDALCIYEKIGILLPQTMGMQKCDIGTVTTCHPRCLHRKLMHISEIRTLSLNPSAFASRLQLALDVDFADTTAKPDVRRASRKASLVFGGEDGMKQTDVV